MKWLWSLSLALLVSCSSVIAGEKEEWKPLFNGKDLTGWTPKFKGEKLGENYLNTFRVEDGLLKVRYDQYEKFDNKFGHLFYEKPYSHYRIRAEYRFVGEQVSGGAGWAFRNNGLMLHGESPETMELDQSFPTSIEVQLLGGNGKEKRSTANLCTPGTNVVLNGELFLPHCTSSSSETFHGDQWVTVEVEVRGNEVFRHYVNGQLVMEYTKPQLDERDEQAKKLAEKAGTIQLSSGTISLQAESHPTDFRKIEILVLEE